MRRVRSTASRLLAALVSLAGFAGCLAVAQWLGDQQTNTQWTGVLPIAPIGVFTSAEDAEVLAASNPSAVWAARVVTQDSALRVGVSIGTPADAYAAMAGGAITQGLSSGSLAGPITLYYYLPPQMPETLTPLQAALFVNPVSRYGPETGCASWTTAGGTTGNVTGTVLSDGGRTLVKCDIPALPSYQNLSLGYEVTWAPDAAAKANFAGRWSVALTSMGEALPFTEQDANLVADSASLQANDLTLGVLTYGSIVLEHPLSGESSGLGTILQTATVHPADSVTLSFRDEGTYRRSEVLIQASWIVAGLLISYVPYWVYRASVAWRTAPKESST